MKHINHIKTFSLIDNSGKEYVVHEYVEIIDGIEGLKILKTDEGYHVNEEEDHYEILDDSRFLTDGIESPIHIQK